MKIFDFDSVISRRGSDSVKWNRFPQDVLPLWVADLDFPSPQEIVDAVQARLAHPFFGYEGENDELLDVICEWISERHGWKIDRSWLLLCPGVVTGMNWAIHALVGKGRKIGYHVPVYPPFLRFAENAAVEAVEFPLIDTGKNYLMDFMEFSKRAGEINLLALCNPHNPVGRVFTRKELSTLAEECLKNDIIICSDEIHCDLVFPGHQHIPIGSLSDEVARKTITLMAPSKTFNVPGLYFSFAMSPTPIFGNIWKLPGVV